MYNSKPRVIKPSLKIGCEEMMFYMNMPVKLAQSSIFMAPKRLQNFERMIDLCVSDFEERFNPFDFNIYLTVKSLIVTPDYIGGRDGWHIDGFGTTDETYIWSDKLETEFCVQDFDLSNDCDVSMRDMQDQAVPENIKTFGEGSLLAIDTRHVHRCPKSDKVMKRTFVKVSFSKDRFDLKGNSHNHLLDYDWPMFDRKRGRNHTSYVPE